MRLFFRPVKQPLKITVEVIGKGYTKQVELLKRIYPILHQDKYWHFMFEPELIIRLSDARVVVEVCNYLRQKDYLFSQYDYPYPKKGFGEIKKYDKLLPLLIPIYHNYSEFWMGNLKHKKFFWDRITHIFLNMSGTSDLGEAETLLIKGMGRLDLFKKNFEKLMIATRRNRA